MAYRTTRKVAERKQQRRRLLLDVATQLFGEHGYHATTVPMVVEASGTSTGSFYSYFRGKEDVFVAVLEDTGERLAGYMNREIAAATDASGQMRAAVRALFRWLADHPSEARIVLVETSGLGGRPEETRGRIVESHVRSVQRALDTLGARIPGPPLIVARCWVGAAYEAARHFLVAAEWDGDVEQLAELVADFNLRGAGLLS
jgi:TetR/AcrR family transcriptional regulator, fatty acid metabolism regulator protein